METITLFSFGYWGWGSATTQLVQAFDAVEAARRYAPPMLVDIRISRSVRAKGFYGPAFETVLGSSRYRWLDALGNLGIQDGGQMRIKDPAAADALLDLAKKCATENRRVIFFCACATPKTCHRSVVTQLVLGAAARRKARIEVIEWPGGAPDFEQLEVELSWPEFEKVRRGAKSIPLNDTMPLSKAGAIPYYSLAAVRPKGEEKAPSWRLVTGPAMYKKSGWHLPVYGHFDGEPPEAIRAEIQKAREANGYTVQRMQD